jgi:hypothetical protein
MTDPLAIGPLDLIGDRELLDTLCARARSGTNRAFVAIYLRPDEDAPRGPTGSPPSTGWSVAAGTRPQDIREALILLMRRMGVGSPADYGWLWQVMVPRYEIDGVALSSAPQATPALHAALASVRRAPMIVDDEQALEHMDELMAGHNLTRRMTVTGWEYVDPDGESVYKLVRSFGFTLSQA